ncbi:MAG: hypothetical protein M3492_13125 [Actinomycetota bacterium]|nr:hypothetical protein [Actinomycetota bacterium]
MSTTSGRTVLSNRSFLTGGRSKHSKTARQLHRRPLIAVVASLVAAGILVGSQPASLEASAEPSRAASGSTSSTTQRLQDVNAAASRGERKSAEPITAPPPISPAAEEALSPDLSESGSAEGPNGTAALTGDPCPTEGFGGVKPHVAEAGYHLMAVFGISESSVGGLASRPGNSASDHPRGYALDFMVNTSTGNALAAYADENSDALGIKYIIWQEPAHYDHVHISFNNSPGSGVTC